MKAGKQEIQETTLWQRAQLVYWGIIAFALFAVVVVLAKQYAPRSYKLRKISNSAINFKTIKEPAKRGNIYSHNGRLLATSITKYKIYMDFNAGGMTDEIFESNYKGLAKGLARFFGGSYAEYERMLRNYRKNRYSYKLITPRSVNYMELTALKQLPLFNLRSNVGGSIVETLYERENPYGSLALRTLGRADKNSDNEEGTLIGVEGAFDKELKGQDGISYQRKISGSFWAPVNNSSFVEPIGGKDVVTTIDIDLQDVAEEALKKSLEKHQADWGTAILMEVETGEIRAIANITRKPDGRMIEDYNYAISETMEPGSTFKLASLISLLDDAGADINEIVDCEDGSAKIGPRVYYDSDAKGYGKISLRRVFEVSSNIGFAKTVEKYYGNKPQDFVDDIRDMGICEDIDFQIAGERKPMLRNTTDKYWDKTSLGMLSTGYSAILITPLRTLMMYNAIANGGKMVAPLLIKRIEEDGQVVKSFGTKVINSSICKTSTLRNIRKSLEGVVYDGTGTLTLLNKYYTIAGKTGTAQVLVNGSYKGATGVHYLGSIAGYFPADKPKYSCIVAIKTFKPYNSAKKYYGGTLSGPVFKAIADRIYAHATDWGYDIEKPILDKEERQRLEELRDKGEDVSKLLPAEQQKESDKTVLSKKGALDKTKRVARYLNIDTENIIFASKSSLKEELDQETETDLSIVPNVTGMGLKDAVEILEQRGMRVVSSGKGTIVRQSVAPGSKVIKGSIVFLSLNL